jgi:flavin reductase (DIM6/NTAB) family NADH-FMN oxidoreductase RutF
MVDLKKQMFRRADDRLKNFVSINVDTLSFSDQYNLLSGIVIPRPIAFVSTLNTDGSTTAAPFSSFMIASVEAALLAFSVGPSDNPKRTLQNIQSNGEFVINMVHEKLANQVQFCGQSHAESTPKVQLAGLTLLESTLIRTPRIADSKIHFECKLHSVTQFGESNMVVGHAVLMHLESNLLVDGRVEPLEFAPLGRIAGRKYCLVRDIISV